MENRRIDFLGRVKGYEYNSKGQLSKKIHPDGSESIYYYNDYGEVTKVLTPNGTAFTFEYDSLGRIVAKGNPDRGITTYTYDISGNILTETNAKGQIKTYTYDIANRKTSVSYSTDSSLNETYEYDQGENAKGKLTKIIDSSGSTEFSYNKESQLTTKIETISNQQFTTTYSYDEFGRIISWTYPSGKIIEYKYDDKGEIVSLSIDGIPFISNIKMNGNGLLSYNYADGSQHTREYDTNGRLTNLIYPNYTEDVTYDNMSNITKIELDNLIDIDFAYDVNNRLTSYEQNETDYQYFTYDTNGNRLTQNQEVNKSREFNYTPNTNLLMNMQYLQTDINGTVTTKDINYEYDQTGNIIKDDKHIYKYDGRNRLVAIDNNVTYQYNYNNRRVSKTVNGVKTYFIYNGHMLTGEYKLNLKDDSRKEHIYLDATPIATSTATQSYKIYADSFDSPRRLATNDNTVIWRWDSKPFGETKPRGMIDFNLRFPGQYFDEETSNHYNINRDYNPVTGRYIQSDPIGLDGGTNTFAYVDGNPATSVDLEGLCGGSDPDPEPEPVPQITTGLIVSNGNIDSSVTFATVDNTISVKTWSTTAGADFFYFTVAYDMIRNDGYVNGWLGTPTLWNKPVAVGFGNENIHYFKGQDKPYYINHYKWYIEIPAQASSNANMGYWYAQITD